MAQGPFYIADTNPERLYFRLFLADDTDPTAPLEGEDGGQPEIDVNGAGFVNTTNTLVELSDGAYYVELDPTELDLGTIVVRYKSGNSKEFQDTAIVVNYDPYDVPESVWTYTTRTLTDYGTLVTDLAQSVWEYITRTLTGWLGGANVLTLTVEDGDGDPVGLCPVLIRTSTGQPLLFQQTNSDDGTLITNLDDGDYLITLGPMRGYGFANVYPVTVAGDTAETLTVSFSPSGIPGGLTLARIRRDLDLHLEQRYPENVRKVRKDLKDEWIEAAHQEIDHGLRWTRATETFATVASQEPYSLTVGRREVTEIELLHSTRVSLLKEVSTGEFIALKARSTTEGTPTHYMRYGDNIHFYPTPSVSDDTLTVYQVADPAPLVNDDDTPEWPVHLHQLILDLALAFAARYFGDPAMEIAARDKVDQRIALASVRPNVERSEGGSIDVRGI